MPVADRAISTGTSCPRVTTDESNYKMACRINGFKM